MSISVRNIKAIIFDMDGVLVDTEHAYLDLFRAFLVKHDKRIIEDELLKVVGGDSKMTWKYISRLWGNENSAEEIREIFHTEYPSDVIDYRGNQFPGIPEMLGKLKNKGYVLALASSSRMNAINRMLSELELQDYFSVVISGEDFKASKPNPEIYLDACEKLNLFPRECLVVEDSNYGIQAGKAAGMAVVAVRDHRFGQDQSDADAFVDDTMDLVQLLEGKN